MWVDIIDKKDDFFPIWTSRRGKTSTNFNKILWNYFLIKDYDITFLIKRNVLCKNQFNNIETILLDFISKIFLNDFSKLLKRIEEQTHRKKILKLVSTNCR